MTTPPIEPSNSELIDQLLDAHAEVVAASPYGAPLGALQDARLALRIEIERRMG